MHEITVKKGPFRNYITKPSLRLWYRQNFGYAGVFCRSATQTCRVFCPALSLCMLLLAMPVLHLPPLFISLCSVIVMPRLSSVPMLPLATLVAASLFLYSASTVHGGLCGSVASSALPASAAAFLDVLDSDGLLGSCSSRGHSRAARVN